MVKRKYKPVKDFYKTQEVLNHNIIMVICSNCSEMFEEYPEGVDSYYSSVACCPNCGSYQNF